MCHVSRVTSQDNCVTQEERNYFSHSLQHFTDSWHAVPFGLEVITMYTRYDDVDGGNKDDDDDEMMMMEFLGSVKTLPPCPVTSCHLCFVP